MPNQDTSQLKEKIYFILKRRGPSLPVHVAKEINLSMLFTSAFLSELYSDKKIKISSMKVGGSPLYFVPGHEYQLERYSQYLGSKEKEAFELLRKEKILKDSEQQPAIRVALRALRDFAIPFRNNNDIFWRYLSVSEQEVRNIFEKKIINEPQKPTIKEIQKVPVLIQTPPQTQLNEKKDEQKTLKVKFESPIDFKKQEKKLSKERPIKIKKEKTKKQKKIKNRFQKTQDEKFFNKVKEYLTKNKIEISDIIGLGKNKLILKVKENENELLIVAFNQRKITEKDIIEAAKRAKEFNINYSILSFGEPSKTLQNIIDASKSLYEVKKIE